MTEEPSLAIEYDRAPTRETDIIVERLEFGKFCVSSDGPIESNRDNIPIGYSQLGWSPGFPGELISGCHPTNLGIAKEGTDVLPLENVYGTVLRPVVPAGKGVRSLFYRVRSRAEDGEGQAGRRYTLARYLAVPEGDANPFSMLAAMNSVPLGGVTRDAASRISSIHSEEEQPKLGHVAEAFLREALIYILSGVALSITEEISETKFFALIGAVHDRLPPVLRPYLSAGWNVGSTYSGKLGITYTTHRSGSTALFSPATLTWSSPEYVTIWKSQDESVVRSFFYPRLEPGRLFERYVFREANSSESSSSVAERLSNLVGSLRRVELPELPDWNDPATVRIFRYPGFQAKDRFALRALAQWLATGEENSDLCLDARALSFQSNRREALNLILEALAESASRPRAEHALWLSITGRVPSSFTDVLKTTGVGTDRARLIAAIGSDDILSTLGALEVAAPDEREDLSDEVAASLVKILDQSLKPSAGNTLPFHSRLLISPPSQYRQWVEQRSLELMRALALDDKTPKEALTALVEISGSDTIRALHYFITDHRLTPTVADLLRGLQPDARSVFIDLLNQQWAQQDDLTALRRDALLDWFDVLKLRESRQPLLRLVSGAELSDADVVEIADDVERLHVPESLWPQVAELALRRWSIVGRRIVSSYQRWVSVTNLWPRRHAQVLGFNNKGMRSPDQKIMRAVNELRMSFGELEHLLTVWHGYDTFNDAALLLWDLAIQLEPRIDSPLTALDLCQHFANARLPDGQLASREFDIFVKLVRGSGRGNLPSEAVQNMWQRASSYWQVRLLLTLFPQENLQPTLAQLSLLIPHQDWLVNHLRDSQTPLIRRGLFRIATEPFHSLSFRESSAWRDDFINTPLWAVFTGVPESQLPPRALRRALRAYTRSDDRRTGEQSDNTIQEQARLCLTFLRSYKGAASEDGATRRVLLEFVLPLLSYRWSRERLEAALAAVGADLKLPGYERPDKYYDRFSPSMCDLVCQILNVSDRKYLSYMIKEFYKRRR